MLDKTLTIVIFDKDSTAVIALIPNAIKDVESDAILKNGYDMAVIDDDDPRIIDVGGTPCFIENRSN